jgi:acetoacetyl-[acyl-carrier protein] synthase
MAVFAASDALSSLGCEWTRVKSSVSPDEMAVYACSSMGQLDDDGTGGMLKSALLGKRTTSKHCPLGFAEMPGDFVNAYVLGNVGGAGGTLGACATFLYNLEHAVQEIQSGRRRIVVVGVSEAPVTPEIMEGYHAMGALCDDDDLARLDGLDSANKVDHRRASRPFSTNTGFTMSESAQFAVLMDDSLALELGLNILASVPAIYVNADGHKKSISSPGIGNYISLAKCAKLAASLLGPRTLAENTFIQAHGTSTPQNRVTESHVFNEVAKALHIPAWKIAAVKSYLGHSLGAAGGDQLMASLGVWEHGVIPGITSIDHTADDIHDSNLSICAKHTETGVDGIEAAFLNSKGFGGNNATALILSPQITMKMLGKKHGKNAMLAYQERNGAIKETREANKSAVIKGQFKPVYHFGENVVEGEDMDITNTSIGIPGFEQRIDIEVENIYRDYCEKGRDD